MSATRHRADLGGSWDALPAKKRAKEPGSEEVTWLVQGRAVNDCPLVIPGHPQTKIFQGF